MASEVDTISANNGDFYAEYDHEAQLLRVRINMPRGPFAEVSTVGFGVWLELKSGAEPLQNYLRFYRPKPPREEEPRIHKSPAVKKNSSEQVAADRR